MRSIAAQYKNDLPDSEKERLAAKIVGASFDAFHGWQDTEWQRKFPAANEIDMMAPDLEISNSFDVDDDWDKLIGFIQAFNKQIDSLLELEPKTKS